MAYLLMFAIVFFFCFFIYATQSWHGKHSLDNASGIQKIHTDPVPRVGGLAIFLAVAFSPTFFPDARDLLVMVSLCALPLFMGGVADDLMKTVSIKARFACSVISAFAFIFASGYMVRDFSFPMLNLVLGFYPIALLLSVLALTGLPHAMNMIDGINGLASGTFVIMATCLYSLACKDNDTPLVVFALVHLYSALAFLIWNFPKARLFLGDGGAYYLGFAIAAGVIMAIVRDDSVSAWTGLMVVIYPVSEALLSVYRRVVRVGTSPQIADNIHMHHFVRRAIARPLARRRNWDDKFVNPLTGAIMWLFPITSCVLARVGQFRDPIVSMSFAIGFFVIYVLIYLSLARRYVAIKPYRVTDE